MIYLYCVVSRIPYAPRSPDAVASVCLDELQLWRLLEQPVLKPVNSEVYKTRNEHLFVC